MPFSLCARAGQAPTGFDHVHEPLPGVTSTRTSGLDIRGVPPVELPTRFDLTGLPLPQVERLPFSRTVSSPKSS